MTLVGENHFFALAAALLSIVALSFRAEIRRRGQKVGGPLLILVVAMALANLRVIPHESSRFPSSLPSNTGYSICQSFEPASRELERT